MCQPGELRKSKMLKQRRNGGHFGEKQEKKGRKYKKKGQKEREKKGLGMKQTDTLGFQLMHL